MSDPHRCNEADCYYCGGPVGEVCGRCEGDAVVQLRQPSGWITVACPDCHGTGRTPPPWLTPLVVSLARAAHEARRVERCGACKGQKGEWKPNPVHYDDDWWQCPTCQGTGTLATGLLDGDRLAVLADALIEAGCPETVACPECGDESPYRVYCTHCHSSGRAGRVPNPLLVHLRDGGPHAARCAALEALLGLEDRSCR